MSPPAGLSSTLEHAAGAARKGARPRARIRWLAAASALGCALGLVPLAPAVAALGSSADSVPVDTAALRGQLVSTALVQYDVQEIDSGTLTVREYVTRSGQVFAITWRGPVMPNLQQLLGSYYPRFQSAAVAAHQANAGIHRQLTVVQPDLVLLSAGRMRDFHGIAYLPALVPEGVSVSDLQ